VQEDPRREVQVSADHLASSNELSGLIERIRSESDGCILLSSGASMMSDESKRALLDLLDALRLLSQRGLRFAVGDGGTQAGLMEAAGLARRASGDAFPLIGVAPAPEITTTHESGKTPVDPHHSQIIAVWHDAWAEERQLIVALIVRTSRRACE
jgi:hypothetical protein